ncbi:spinster family MFS transporter [Sphingomonas crusticola]|uniref:spinster family MFS transporter n=1 Tax=Sphingomonas crusticola TaxID=1697973 RepID=UPI000E25BF72|nr:MFS transporter [Sphingomonas crusticola]
MPKIRWPIALLTLVYVLNFVDRQLVGILGQPMKVELGLTDGQLGLLSGLAFALFYTTLGLPVARIAERKSRPGVIAISLGIWSAMTALCGLAQSVPQLVLARLGVGLGEAGYAPTAQSLIADLVPPGKRATALSLFSLGIPAGMLIGAIAGGWLAQSLGWRMAFVWLGVPGILLAILMALVLRDPRQETTPSDAPPLRAVAVQLWHAPGFAHMAAGASIASFAGYGLTSFAVPLLMRVYGLPLRDAATGFGIVAGIAIAIGIGSGGWLADGQRRDGGAGRVAAAGALMAALLFPIALSFGDPRPLAMAAVAPLAGAHLYFGPTYGLTVNSVGPKARATAIAILLMVMNAIGLGLGPLAVGALSDSFASAALPGYAAACQSAACTAASATGLVKALRIDLLLYFWAALHFLLAGRAVRLARQQGVSASLG